MDEPIIAIARFSLKEAYRAETERFEKAMDRFRTAVAGAAGLRRTLLLRGAGQPGEYALLTWWRDADAHRSVIGELSFFVEVTGELMLLGDLTAAKAATLSAYVAPGADPAEAGIVACTDFALNDPASAEDFQHGFAAKADFMRAQEGFVAQEFLQSKSQVGGYLNLGWWRDMGALQASFQKPEFAEDVQKTAAVAVVKPAVFEVMSDSVFPPS
ncbi:antibiotic biosynthesis monooxygenase [Actinomadura sp. NPDC048394]|uniref:antibiotic biosynthesis monooxygenase family protein n=1 Tax=Actinomadura sp. NPDC048394 TaxID=3158223 RepID=UPI0033CE068D